MLSVTVTLVPCDGQVDALRLRLEEKEATLNKKSKQIQEISEEKGTLNGEIHDLKDMLEVKERKINVLQKKVNNGCCLESTLSGVTLKIHSLCLNVCVCVCCG